MDDLVSTAWLAQNLRQRDLTIVDSSWFMPALGRDARKEFLAAHIPGARFLDIDEVADTSSAAPHMLPSAGEFGAAMEELGIGKDDRIIVAPFSRTLGTITGPTDDRATVSEAISAIGPRGGTAILDSLESAADMIATIEGRHAIILLTDGYDEHSTQAFDDALAAVQRTGAAVYVVGIGGVAGISLKG